MHIGLIGGIGPAATVSYYLSLVAAFKALEKPLELTIVNADINVLLQNAAAGRKQKQAQIFERHLNQLKGAGCDVALITALTGHFCFAETKALSPIELISGTKIIDDYCAAERISTIGLLGSPPVLATHLFGLLKVPKTVIPADNLEALGDAYMELANNGVCSAENRQLFFGAGEAMVRDQGAEAILLAGTDLGLAFDGQQPEYRIIDALQLHVKSLVDMATA